MTCGDCRSLPGLDETCRGADGGSFLPCAEGLLCTPVTVDNVCLDAPDVGEECNSDEACVPDAQCIDGLCRAPLLEGEACGPDVAGFCPRGLFCGGAVCARPIPVGDGEDCDAAGFFDGARACVDRRGRGSRCGDEDGDGVGVCSGGALTPPGGVGEACNFSRPCDGGLVCNDAQETCVELPTTPCP